MKPHSFFGYVTLLALIRPKAHLRVGAVKIEGRTLKASSRIEGKSLFLEGSLGRLNLNVQGIIAPDVREEGKRVLEEIIDKILGGTGDEVVQAAPEKVRRDKSGGYHIRYHHYIDGLMVEGASMMLHVDGSDGTVTAVNGEFGPTKLQDHDGERGLQELPCEQAIQAAVQQLGVAGATQESACELSAVYADDGYFQKAWKALVGYEAGDEPYQLDEVFASLDVGRLLARFPTIHGGLGIETYDCNWSNTDCGLVSSNPEDILPFDPSSVLSQAVADAHNYAIDTYNYFYYSYGRDSIDNRGMKLKSRVNYAREPGKPYLNAFWNGVYMTYGTGDRTTYYPFSRGCDVVAHEMMHGITQRTSGLRYVNESGALNEAFSDIFGAVVERASRRKSITETFLIGEDLFRKGGFIRNMANPAERRHNDHYSKLYVETKDNGGVHNNSGIMNLAFALAVKGGYHPNPGPGVSSDIFVPEIDWDFDVSLNTAALIWYLAGSSCLTSLSQFLDARQCTLMFSGPHAASVAAAWDAVGVIPPIPPSPAPTPPPTPSPTTARPIQTRKQLSTSQCVEAVKRSCRCVAFIRRGAACWRRVVIKTCNLGGTVYEERVRIRWSRFCKAI